MSNYKFETLQLHVGQEQPDPATDSRAVPIYADHVLRLQELRPCTPRPFRSGRCGQYLRTTDQLHAGRAWKSALRRWKAALRPLRVASGAAAITYTIRGAGAGGRSHRLRRRPIYGGSYNLLAHTLQRISASPRRSWTRTTSPRSRAAIQREHHARFIWKPSATRTAIFPTSTRLRKSPTGTAFRVVVDNTFGTPVSDPPD